MCGCGAGAAALGLIGLVGMGIYVGGGASQMPWSPCHELQNAH